MSEHEERRQAAERGRRAMADMAAAEREQAGWDRIKEVLDQVRAIENVSMDYTDADPWGETVTVHLLINDPSRVRGGR